MYAQGKCNILLLGILVRPIKTCKQSQLGAQFFLVCLFLSVHVSGDYVPITRRNKCIYATFGTCYSVWMTVWYALESHLYRITDYG